MVGGTYLAFEGAEKVWERLRHHDDHVGDLPTPAVEHGPDAEKRLIAGAVRTDLILSAEIMVIALDEVADEGFWARLGILVVVAVAITIAVYGVVALIVKMDDVGLALAQRGSAVTRRFGRGLVRAMPRLLATIALVGTVAMLWVGGHILLVNLHEVGWWDAPYELLHDLEHEIEHAVGAAGGVLAWCASTAVSAVVGLVVGAVVVAVVHLLPSRRGAH
jgi:predicted DNA repair protein MutK